MSRRKKRYERRLQKRKESKEKHLQDFQKFENVCSYDSLYKAVFSSAKGVNWKESVQRYKLNIFSNIVRTKNDLIAGKDIRGGFIEFDICERGKPRHIRSVHFRERVVQKSLCQNSLTPVISYHLIADNGASQKDKGTLYATQRLVKSLVKHYNKYGNKGYVLLLDFKSYFDNIQHKPLKEVLQKYFTDQQILNLANDFIDAFGDKGLGLGSETSQINAIVYINEIDHYIKEVARIKGYGRYMDDSYVIHHSKEYLQDLLNKLKVLYKKYGIVLNEKKTYITDLKHGFTFLKTRFYITDSGKILRKPCRDVITRQRKRLKGQARLLAKGVLNLKDIETSYVSWKGSMLRRQARKTIYTMNQLYNELFEMKGEQND